MRTINATLTTAQASLFGLPCHSLIVGTGGSTVDLSAYLLAYTYNENDGDAGSHEFILDNQAGTFNSLTGDLAYITEGAVLTLSRGITVSGTDYTAELPRLWIEEMSYRYGDSQSLFVLRCIDSWDRLYHYRLASDQSWSSTSTTTILAWILTQVGLTRAAGTMASLSIDFEITTSQRLLAALDDLLDKIPEYLYFGLDAEIKWKQLDPDEASVYTFGWNANHPIVEIHESTTKAWEVNSVTVTGADGTTGTVSNAAQIAKVGTRRLSVHDVSLTTNTQCTNAATAYLRQYQAYAQEVIITCKPVHGLEMYDVVTLSSPPWGGSNVVGRVIGIKEIYSAIKGKWEQTITLGNPTSYRNRNPKCGWWWRRIDPNNIRARYLSRLARRTGCLDIDNALKVHQDGYIHSGQTAYNTGTGFWMEYNNGTPRISIGNAAGNRVTWNGSTLAVRGTVTADDGELGDLDVSGDLLIGSGGAVRSGQTAYGTGTGFWIGNVSGTPRFSIGTAAGERLTWSGSALTVRGTINAEDGTLEDLTVNGTLIIGSGGAIRSGQTAYDTGTGFYFEYNGGTPRFSIGNASGEKITWNGSSLTVTGTINAQDGTLQTLSVTGTLTLSGSGKLVTAASPNPRIEIDTGFIAGYSDATTKEFYIDASDGKAYFGGGTIELNSDGMVHNSLTEYDIIEIQDSGTPIGYLHKTANSRSGLKSYTGNNLLLVSNSEAMATTPFRVKYATEDGDTLFWVQDAATGMVQVTYDLRVGSGLYVGSTGTNPDADDIHFDGNLKSHKNATDYDVYGFHPLTSPLTSTSWDGDSFSTTAKTQIDLSAVFGAPAGVKAVLCDVCIRDSGSAGTDCRLVLSDNATAGSGTATRCSGLANDSWHNGNVIIPCNANGDIYYQIQASGAGTFEAYIVIRGYWI